MWEALLWLWLSLPAPVCPYEPSLPTWVETGSLVRRRDLHFGARVALDQGRDYAGAALTLQLTTSWLP